MSRKTILVQHFAGLMPLAGIAWQAMHYVLALKRLGFDVWYVEDNGVNPYSPKENQLVWDSTENIAFVRRMMERFDMGDRWAYWDPVKEGSWHGVSRERLFGLYGQADGLINLCGSTKLREEHMACPVRILIDTDPGYEQIKLAQGDAYSTEFIDAHTHLFSYGANLGQPDCLLPVGERRWRATRPPVLLDLWPAELGRAPAAYSSVATWQNKGKNVRWQGETYQWSKHVNFLKFLDLPERAKVPFELALITPDPAVNAEVAAKGWRLVDPIAVSETMESYGDFIRASRGEFTVAKDIYVRARSGWFSDRSVCYLASGRPVLMQETGFSKFVPVGKGLYSYVDHDGALAALDAIEGDYKSAQCAARQIAETHLDAMVLVKEIVEAVGL
ncbi:MAG: hypothetical protein HYR63_07515 [Proteobacteria bacterium]|nr:hypothetical protein [Pseudomonadota bacterium]